MNVLSMARSMLVDDTGCILALREEPLITRLVLLANTTPLESVVV